MNEKELLTQWARNDSIYVLKEYLVKALELLTANGYSSVFIYVRGEGCFIRKSF